MKERDRKKKLKELLTLVLYVSCHLHHFKKYFKYIKNIKTSLKIFLKHVKRLPGLYRLVVSSFKVMKISSL